jgi:hypothetical protein
MSKPYISAREGTARPAHPMTTLQGSDAVAPTRRRYAQGEAAGLTVENARRTLQLWMKARDYSGFEPYDLLNSPHLSSSWVRRLPWNVLLIQLGKRFGGVRLRQMMRVPVSKNPKALGLLLSAYSDLARCGEDTEEEARYLKSELRRLRSPKEELYSWGYDWDYASLRGTRLSAFSPNCVATCFCGSALLDMHEAFGDPEAEQMGYSAGEFLVTRLSRTVDTPTQLCFSYTPADRTLIYNNSVLAGALLARLGARNANREYMSLARRTMQFLADEQRPNGFWTYGVNRWQQWVDSFHTAYNLVALLDYQQASGDDSFDKTIRRGYRYYVDTFFRSDGAPKYFDDAVYPLDIHSCAQAIVTFCAFSDQETEAKHLAWKVMDWTLAHMRDTTGAFYYQLHRFWTDRTPYMRWGQAWMFRALVRMQRQFALNV